MDKWEGCVAVVTGASSGIGLNIAESLVRSGIKVVGLARRLELLEDSARRWSKLRGSFYPIKCDVSKEDDILNSFEKIEHSIGKISILINNAAVLVPERIIGNYNLFFFLIKYIFFLIRSHI